MYERSAIVLERYFEKIFGFTKENNLKLNYENYCKMLEAVKEYQKVVEEEEKVIVKFDEVAKEIEEIQNEQAELHKSNLELENARNVFFNDLGENPNTLDTKLQKIEGIMDENNEKLKDLREKYVKSLVIFTQRQKERNKFTRIRRAAETNHMNNIDNANQMFNQIDVKDVKKIKDFMNCDKEQDIQEIINIMIKNGKSEKVAFYDQAISLAVNTRMLIAQKEAELYLSTYERMKKLLNDLNNENIKLGKAEKLLRDASVKLAFLRAEKEYIIGFLDNERMTSINGKRTHEKLMEEACKNFEVDIKQIDNLYQLIIKETMGKATKKAYNELYNKTYLRDIESRQKYLEEEITSARINMGTVINSNYWRIEGLKNIYNVFQEEVSEKFNKDLSDYKVEEIETDDTELLPDMFLNSKNKEKQEISINRYLDYNDESYDEDDDEITRKDKEKEEQKRHNSKQGNKKVHSAVKKENNKKKNKKYDEDEFYEDDEDDYNYDDESYNYDDDYDNYGENDDYNDYDDYDDEYDEDDYYNDYRNNYSESEDDEGKEEFLRGFFKGYSEDFQEDYEDEDIAEEKVENKKNNKKKIAKQKQSKTKTKKNNQSQGLFDKFFKN